MSREKVLIELCCPFPYKAGGQLLATLAYPDRDRGGLDLRYRFLWALCRWLVLRRARKEPEFATNAQPIVPAIFTADHTDYLHDLESGNKKLNERLVAANWIVLPHLKAVMTGKLEEVEGEYPHVYHLAQLAMENLGRKGKTQASFEADAWAPTRPVAHAAAAYLYWQQTSSKSLPANTTFLEICLEEPRMVAQIIETSEELRPIVAMIKQFKKRIEEQDMIEFTPVLDGGTLSDFIGSGS
jgi:hypothetical protein